MDHTERIVVREKLHTNGVVGQVMAHELYRCFKVHGRGLTPGELKYLEIRHRELVELLDKLSQFRQKRL